MKTNVKLDLEADERVEFAIRRADVFLITTWIGVILACIVIAVVIVLINANQSKIAGALPLNGFSWLMGFVGVMVYLMIIGVGMVATKVHFSNRLFITNKRVFEYEMKSLFSNSMNIIDLKSIEDVSVKQNGMIDHMLGVGTLRMSTVGDETTYTFERTKMIGPSELKRISALVAKAKEGK